MRRLTAHQRAVELNPGRAETFLNIGCDLDGLGQPEKAAEAYRRAILLKPGLSKAHNNLAVILAGQNRMDEMLAVLQRAAAADPENPEPPSNIGALMAQRGDFEAALTWYQKAVRLRSEDALDLWSLGNAMASLGRYAEALPILEKARRSVNPAALNWNKGLEDYLQNVREMTTYEARLPRVALVPEVPRGPREWQLFARVATERKWHAAAARLWAGAFAEEPRLVGDATVQNRYNAACSAALAGCGQGKDDPCAGRRRAKRLRDQALAWIRDDLKQWMRLAETSETPRDRVAEVLRHWRSDLDLAGVRDCADPRRPPCRRAGRLAVALGRRRSAISRYDIPCKPIRVRMIERGDGHHVPTSPRSITPKIDPECESPQVPERADARHPQPGTGSGRREIGPVPDDMLGTDRRGALIPPRLMRGPRWPGSARHTGIPCTPTSVARGTRPRNRKT